VDDSETLVGHVRRVLSERDPSFRFLTAANGLDGFKALLGNQVDLVLCDLWMPDMDGFKFLSFEADAGGVRRYPGHHVDRCQGRRREVKGLEAGASDYLTKPFDDEELLARVRVHLKIRGLQEELREKNARLEELSNTDGLTGLTNRRHFMELAAVELMRSKRYDTQLALVMVDIDHFKPVNDRFGHLVGDRALVSVAAMLTRDLRRHDIAARYGGRSSCSCCHPPVAAARSCGRTLPAAGRDDAGDVGRRPALADGQPRHRRLPHPPRRDDRRAAWHGRPRSLHRQESRAQPDDSGRVSSDFRRASRRPRA